MTDLSQSSRQYTDYDSWLAEHEAQLEMRWRPTFKTSSGFDVAPVYTPEHVQAREWDYTRDVGLPGQEPYTRGFVPGGYRRDLWNIEMYAGFGTAEDANKRYRYLLDHGSTGGVSMALDLPTQIGLDADHPLARDEVGQVGVSLSSLADVERVFEGIPLDRIGHVFTTANAIGPIAAAWFLALAEKQGVETSEFRVQIQNDPIKEYIARGTQFLPIEAAIKLSADTVEYIADAVPTWLPISVSGSHMKQAGSTCVQEAAFTICNAIAYVDACLARGMSIDSFGHLIELHFCTEMDFFEEVAKYRATRKVWASLVRERFGGTTARAQHFRLHAATSGRPLTVQQPLNNISRITLQILAQVLGGCEQTRTASFDEALGIPTELAARTSIRANQIIAHETGVPYTVDPLGGSYYLESLTAEFEDRIRSIIREVDEMGGAAAATRDGYFQRAIAEGAYREQREVDSRERLIVGVNAFQSENVEDIAVFSLDRGVIDRQVARLRETRARRDSHVVGRALEHLRVVCASSENVVPAVLECVKAYATTGEIADTWRAVYGEYVPETVRL
jgi:methylmalonyl-CoA mutase N-terminal domain/subunit